MPPVISILATNLLPVFSVAFLGWSAFSLVLLYWIENLIIGAFNVVKILIAGISAGRAGALATLFIVPFFIFHYGMFCFVHGVFICVMFSALDSIASPPSSPVDLAQLVLDRMHTDSLLFWNVIVMAAFHLFKFLRYWIGAARWREADPFSQMFAPYARIVVVHLTIMIGTIPVLLLGQPMIAVLCLALLKTGLETGRMKIFNSFAENPALAAKTRELLKVLGNHTRP